MNQAKKNLLDYFGGDKPITRITEADAESWSRWLATEEGLARNTAARRIGRAKQFFTWAVKRRLLTVNPFAGLKSAVHANAERFVFVTREMVAKVLDACPDATWRLMIALARYGGLRCPSEVLLLRWSDVNWETGRITVSSPKTEHHMGGEYRVIPIFEELRPHLEEAFEQAEPGVDLCFPKHQRRGKNLRTQLGRIIRRAGLEPWGKPWQNMRSSRETELVETFPIQTVCKWIGNTEAVARKHYLQTTDEHFARAIGAGAKGDAKSGALVTQNAAQHPSAHSRTSSQEKTKAPAKQRLMRSVSGSCEGLREPSAP